MLGWTFVLKRDLEYYKSRIAELERQQFELLNRCLTKNNNFAMPPPSESKPVPIVESAPVEMVQGYTKEDFISFEMESGFTRPDALEMWERTLETGLMPWQWEVPPFAKEGEVVDA